MNIDRPDFLRQVLSEFESELENTGYMDFIKTRNSGSGPWLNKQISIHEYCIEMENSLKRIIHLIENRLKEIETSGNTTELSN